VLRDKAVAITPLRHEGLLPGDTKEFDLSAMLAG
jgi:5'-nucleotidase